MIPPIVASLVGYLLGSLPFGYIVARAHGVDIFKVGSGSPGATNVKRVLGARAGNTVFVLDAIKGALAVGAPFLYFLWRGPSPEEGSSDATTLQLCGVLGLGFALVGHSFSCFTGFRGGKGVATAAGGLIVLMPPVCLIALAAWLLFFFATRYVSLASIVSAISLPLSAWALRQPGLYLGLAVVIAAFVVIRHRANISRLMAGTENRFSRGAREAPKP